MGPEEETEKGETGGAPVAGAAEVTEVTEVTKGAGDVGRTLLQEVTNSLKAVDRSIASLETRVAKLEAWRRGTGARD